MLNLTRDHGRLKFTSLKGQLLKLWLKVTTVVMIFAMRWFGGAGFCIATRRQISAIWLEGLPKNNTNHAKNPLAAGNNAGHLLKNEGCYKTKLLSNTHCMAKIYALLVYTYFIRTDLVLYLIPKHKTAYIIFCKSRVCCWVFFIALGYFIYHVSGVSSRSITLFLILLTLSSDVEQNEGPRTHKVKTVKMSVDTVVTEDKERHGGTSKCGSLTGLTFVS